MLELYTNQPQSVYIYYYICSEIEWHNRIRFDDLKLEKNLGTHSLDRRVNMSIVSVSVVDTYNVATPYLEYEKTSNVLLCYLVKEVINNNLYSRPNQTSTKENWDNLIAYPCQEMCSSTYFSNMQKRRLYSGWLANYYNQGMWRIFHMKTTWMWYLCRMEDLDDDNWHFNSKYRR